MVFYERSIENQSPIDISILYDESIVHSDFHEYTIGNLENENIVKIVLIFVKSVLYYRHA